MQKRVLLSRSYGHLPGMEEILSKEVEIIRSAGKQKLPEEIGSVHGLLTSGIDITELLIKNAPLLQVIATPTVGFDNIDVGTATRYGIPVIANTGGVAQEPVIEFVLGFMIALARKMIRINEEMHTQKNWKLREAYFDPNVRMGVDIYGSTIGIVGFGNIGSGVARVGRVLGARVLAFDPFVTEEQMAAVDVEKRTDLASLAREVHFLTVHVDLNQKTHHLITREVLRAMRPDACLINCARGAVVDEVALIEALRKGWIAGAGLDVFTEEPVHPDNPLLSMDNVILSPHIAGVSVGSGRRRGEEIVRRLLSVLAGKQPQGLVNPEVWTKYLDKFQASS